MQNVTQEPPAFGTPFHSSHQATPPQNEHVEDELLKIFNTALLSTRTREVRNMTTELYSTLQTPAFQAILSAIRQLSIREGVGYREAAEQVIQTFRKVDQIWSNYVFQEGIERLKNPTPSDF